MKPDSRPLALVITALVLALAQQDAEAGLFKKKNKSATVPAGEQLAAAESAADTLMAKARSAEEAGKDGAALDGYKKIVTTYPYSKAAPTAQFRIAAMYENNKKYEKAFEAYQELITTYRQTPQFSEALDRQFAIAMQGRTTKSRRFLGIKMHASAEDTVDMLNKVIASAPQGVHAAEAQFEIARIFEEEKDADKAIAAYRKVVENYPRSALAADAQSKIGRTYLSKVEKGNRDRANIDRAQDAVAEADLFGNRPPELLGMKGAIDDAAAESAYSTGRFYQKAGNYKAAMIYYSDVLRHPGAPHYEEVRERVNEMSSRDPKVMDSVKNLALDSRSLAVPAASDIKGRAEYFGPPGPAPRIAAVRRPQMRNDYVPYAPLEPADLPNTPGTADPSLLDPNKGLPPPDGTAPAPAPIPDVPPALEPPALEPLPAPEAPKAEEKPAAPAGEQPKSN
ncbi:MAG TPA: tetratricopeptide repeat protein [Verrucomicrobiales bacterium]|nr:tetratricopeptide repeat protein [Verrucomicrobiales bacterium]